MVGNCNQDATRQQRYPLTHDIMCFRHHRGHVGICSVMRDFVLIYVNGQRRELRGPRVFESLSDFLRYELQLTGTKVVCAEGDCGSCTVFVGRPTDGRIAYQTVCSCIQRLYQLDGCHIVTVEGLK